MTVMYYVAVDTEMDVPHLVGPFDTRKYAEDHAETIIGYDTEIVIAEEKMRKPSKSLQANGVSYDIDYTRRRYGNVTYTWVEVRVDDEWHHLGDPWPCITPKKSEVIREINNVLSRLGKVNV